MFKPRLREERGKTVTEVLSSFHTFSFSRYFDPFNMGFSDLRAINDNTLKPDGVFDFQTYKNMEIINIILEGNLIYKNSAGKSEMLSPGHILIINAGKGAEYGYYNPSSTKSSRFFQIWILPKKKNLEPSYNLKYFHKNKMTNKMKLIVSGSGKNDSLKIRQDTEIYRCFINSDISISYDIPPNRKLWIQVANGAIDVNSHILETGDGIALVNERGYLDITGVENESDFLLFSLRNLTM